MADTNQKLDPVYLSSRREALFILSLFGICLVWAMGVYYCDGFFPSGAPAGEVPIVLGMPRWVFWGIFVPWVLVDLVTIWFVFCFMQDEDLGESSEKDAG